MTGRYAYKMNTAMKNIAYDREAESFCLSTFIRTYEITTGC